MVGCVYRSRCVFLALMGGSLTFCLAVGVVGSGRGVTEYERMGKHKFDEDKDD